jgi:hypothetical protein
VGERLGPAGERLVPVDREIGEERDLLAAMVDPSGDEEDRPVGPGARCLLVELREDDDLDRPLEVFDRGDTHGRLGLRDDRPEAGHDAGDDDPLAVERLVLEVAAVGGDEGADLRSHLAHWVLGEVDPEQLLFPAETLADGNLRRLGQRSLEGGGVLGAEIEERCLAADPIPLRGLTGGDRVVEPQQDLRRMTERVERPNPCQRLEDLAVGETEVDARAEVRQ